jgi:hypothetical protein
MTEETMQKLAGLAQQRRSEIEALLSPDELQEFDLRTSDTANRLRQELNGFHPTEQEFRQLYQMRKTFEEVMNSSADVRDPAVLQTRIETEKRLTDKAKADLGGRRFEEFQRSQDIDYQNTLRLVEYFGLPEKAAADVYDLKVRDQKQAAEIEAEANATDAQRAEAFDRMQTNSEQRLTEILGKRVFDEYRRSNRWWMRNQ